MMAKGPVPMKQNLIILLLCTGLCPLYPAEKQGVRRGYENPYKANIVSFVPSKENLLGQYKKAYAACEKVLKTLPADTQSLQVLSCWKNMIHALKSLHQYEKLEPLRREFLARYPRNIPFLAGLDMEAVAPFGYWKDHQFYRGEPGQTDLPIFSKLKEDRRTLLRYLTDPVTLQAAEQAADPELKRLYFLNLRKILLVGNESLSPRELEILNKCTKILRKDPLNKASLKIRIPSGDIPANTNAKDLHSVLNSLFANDKTCSFRDLKQCRLSSGGYGWMSDITEAPHLLLTAWGCEATQFLGRTMNDPAAIAETSKTATFLSNHLAERYQAVKAGKATWNDDDAFLACAAGRLGYSAAIMRMYTVRKTLSPFANIMIARALPESTGEYRQLRKELQSLQPTDAKTMAAYLVFLRETSPGDLRIPQLQQALRKAPHSLWKARALYGEKTDETIVNKPYGLTIKADPANGILEIVAENELHFLRIGVPGNLPAPQYGFRTYDNGTRAIHRTTEKGQEYLLFCKLPAGRHIIHLPPFDATGKITAECYNF